MAFRMKNSEFERIINGNALNEFCSKELPARISLPVAMAMRALQEAAQLYLAEKEKILVKFEEEACTQKDEDGKPIRQSFNTQHEGFQAEWLDFMDGEIELPCSPVEIDLEALEEKGLFLTPLQQLGMYPLIKFVVSEDGICCNCGQKKEKID